MRQERLAGLDAVHATTALLQRIATSDPPGGLYQPAEPEFWWARPRRTDAMDQLYWFDDDGQPEAAAVFYDFGDNRSIMYTSVTFCPFTLPGATPERIAEVIDAGAAIDGKNAAKRRLVETCIIKAPPY